MHQYAFISHLQVQCYVLAGHRQTAELDACGREHAAVEALYRSGAEIYSVMKNANPGIIKRSKKYALIKETDVEKVCEFAHRCAKSHTFPETAKITTSENQQVTSLARFLLGKRYKCLTSMPNLCL